MTRRGLKRAGMLVVSVLATLILVPLLSGHPLVSYPVSGSMVPTIGPFDVFFVDPFPGTIQPGDIIVFDSISHGGPAVHRVVDGDEHGWLTQGDANPNVDQMAGEPVVTKDRILGRVVTLPDGKPLVIPQAGVPLQAWAAQVLRAERAVGGAGRLASLTLLGTAAILAIVGRVWDRPAPPRPPSPRAKRWLRRAFPRGVLGRHVGLALVVLLAGAAALAVHEARVSVDTSLIVVLDEGAADKQRATTPGHALGRDVRVGSLGLLPTLAIAEPGTPGIATHGASARIPSAGTAMLQVNEVAGPLRGLQEDTVHVWRYPAILPDAWTLALHRAAPGLPDVVLSLGVALMGYAWYRALGVANLSVGRWIGFREAWR